MINVESDSAVDATIARLSLTKVEPDVVADVVADVADDKVVASASRVVGAVSSGVVLGTVAEVARVVVVVVVVVVAIIDALIVVVVVGGGGGLVVVVVVVAVVGWGCGVGHCGPVVHEFSVHTEGSSAQLLMHVLRVQHSVRDAAGASRILKKRVPPTRSLVSEVSCVRSSVPCSSVLLDSNSVSSLVLALTLRCPKKLLFARLRYVSAVRRSSGGSTPVS
jgi:hypothetical protein